MHFWLFFAPLASILSLACSRLPAKEEWFPGRFNSSLDKIGPHGDASFQPIIKQVGWSECKRHEQSRRFVKCLSRHKCGYGKPIKQYRYCETKKKKPGLRNQFANREIPADVETAYNSWSEWAPCSTQCTTKRVRRCKKTRISTRRCGRRRVVRQSAYCYVGGGRCHDVIWNLLQTQLNDQSFDVHLSPLENPQPLTCGETGPRYRIIGGRKAYKGKWPWLVAIMDREGVFCGGSLINPRWVLTAAHCVKNKLFVIFGEHDLSKEDGTETFFKVDRTISHPRYNSFTADNDIALLHLPHEASTLISTSASVCLPPLSEPPPINHRCVIVGWGTTDRHAKRGSTLLREAKVPVVPWSVCRDAYRHATVTKNMFCAGDGRGKSDSCQGDSGGPLLCSHEGRWQIHGLISWGDGCATRGSYGIYTKVSNYIEWINNTITNVNKIWHRKKRRRTSRRHHHYHKRQHDQ